jgi:hypothetical protein
VGKNGWICLDLTHHNIAGARRIEELDVPAVSALWRAIAEVKQRRSVIGWVTKIVLS